MDVTLSSEDEQQVKAHRVTLSQSSPVFKDLNMNNNDDKKYEGGAADKVERKPEDTNNPGEDPSEKEDELDKIMDEKTQIPSIKQKAHGPG